MPATSPQAGDVHVNRPLTNFGMKFIQDTNAFVATRAMPNLPVQFQSDLYWIYNIGDMNRRPGASGVNGLVRADGTESAGSQFRVTTANYAALVRALHKDVSDRQRANSEDGIDLDRDAAQFVAQQLLIEREILFSNTYMQAGIWTASDQNVNWSGTTSDPMLDIRAGIRTVHGRTGYRPNKMVIGRSGYDTLLENDAVIARINGSTDPNRPAIATRALLAQLFELEEIFVMDGVVNSAIEGATDALAFIAPDNALLYYAPPSAAMTTVTAGMQFSWAGYTGATPAGFRVKRFRMEQLASDRIEGEMAFDYRVTSAALGYLFTSVSA
jgi:hypothetical protein